MPPEGPGARHWVRAAFIVWSAVVVAVCVRAALAPRRHSVYPIYAQASRDWRSGAELYLTGAGRPAGLEPYRYSPAVAALFVPLSGLPDAAGGVLWRLLGAAAFLGGWAWFCAAVLPGWHAYTRAARAGLWLLLVPLSVGSVANGQANTLVAGLLMGGTAAVARRRWNVAACCFAVACLFKGYPLALGLLLAAVHPLRFGPRFAAALAVGLAAPFALQEAEYVERQYREWAAAVGADDRSDWPLVEGYRDLWQLCRVAAIPMSRDAYLWMQLAAAAAAALLCVAARRAGWDRRRLLVAAFCVGTCWMVLCGPATESSTYTLLAPVAAWAVLTRHAGSPWLALAGYGLIALTQASCWFPFGREFKALGPEPLGALLLTAALGCRLRLRWGTVSRPCPSADRRSPRRS